jgi:hypothetical protein
VTVAVILQDTACFGQLLTILGGGAASFMVILPLALSRIR